MRIIRWYCFTDFEIACKTGSGSAWLERLLREQEAVGSNPTFPTIFMKKLAHVYYSGRVQGIGFRFTAQRIAEELGICGWVKNLDDGRVEVSAEASEDKLNDFLAQVNSACNRYIQDTQVSWEPATGEFHDFGVRF